MMSAFSFSMVLDLAVVILLIATLAHTFALHRKLTQLRGDKREMEALIGCLVSASEQARKGIEDLGAHAGEAGTRLQKDLDRARARADELAFLIETAEAAARRLDDSRAAARVKDAAAPAPKAPPAQPAPAAPATPAQPKTARPAPPRPAGTRVPPEEASLLKMLQGMR